MSLNIHCNLVNDKGEVCQTVHLLQTLSEETERIFASGDPATAYLEWLRSRNNDGWCDDHIAQIERLIAAFGDNLEWSAW